jgi:hypothetical protein
MVGKDQVDDAGLVELGRGTAGAFCSSGALATGPLAGAETGGSSTDLADPACPDGTRLLPASAVWALAAEETTRRARDIRAIAERGLRIGIRDRSGFIGGPPVEADFFKARPANPRRSAHVAALSPFSNTFRMASRHDQRANGEPVGARETPCSGKGVCDSRGELAAAGKLVPDRP